MSESLPVRVLLLDDEADVLRLWELMLRHEPYEVISCSSAADALRLAADTAFDVVVCDHSMPGMTGLQFLEILTRLHPTTVKVMATAHSTYGFVSEAFKRGDVDHYLAKPFPAAQLRQILRSAAWRVRAGRRRQDRVRRVPSAFASAEVELQPGAIL